MSTIGYKVPVMILGKTTITQRRQDPIESQVSAKGEPNERVGLPPGVK